MSYDIAFKLKAEGIDYWVNLGATDANITWNVRDMIRLSTGLEWENEKNNGLCVDIMPAIERGLYELRNRPSRYKKYEAPNGWGTIDGCKHFFKWLLRDWEIFCLDHPPEVVNAVTFWIE